MRPAGFRCSRPAASPTAAASSRPSPSAREGVLLGTCLVASQESGAHPAYKRRIVEARAEDSVVTDVFEIGWPGLPERALRNATIDAWESEREPRIRPSERPVEVIATRPMPGRDLEIPRWWVDTPHAGDLGAVEDMALYAGPAAGLVREVLPAAEIVRRIASDADEVLERMRAHGSR